MAPSLRPPRPHPRRQSSRPVRSNRSKVKSYNEDSSSGDEPQLDSESEVDEDRPSTSRRPRRSNRAPSTYREDATDDDHDDPDDLGVRVSAEALTTTAHPRPHATATAVGSRPGRAMRSHKRRLRSTPLKQPSKKKRLEIGRPLFKRKKTDTEDQGFVGSGVIPPWQTLPYHILFDIFSRASYPLVDEWTIRRLSSAQWLVNSALVCRAFHEPALAALYHCPPLIPAAKCHVLVTLLSLPQESLSTNYANKIKELHVDVETLLLYKSGPTLGYFDLAKLIEKTPQVKKIRLYHKDDHVVGVPSWHIPTSKWTYPESLFETIGERELHLRSWDWNSRFQETEQLLPSIMAKHQQAPFRGLEELRLLHLASEDLDPAIEPEAASRRELLLASAIKSLTELRRLEFIECSIVNEQLFRHLPLNLTSLTISNCDEVTSSNLSRFLATHGHHLRELILNHNRHLNMSFVVALAQSCRHLVRLKMDLSIHDTSIYRDIEPHFENLLSPSEVPTWPVTLQDVELTQLRNWDDKAAEVFFQSLIDSALSLRDLRRLVISAILKIGWRDRATLREKWIGRLEAVFLRHPEPPNPTFRSVRSLRNPPALSTSIEGDASGTDYLTHSDAPTGNETGSPGSTPSKKRKSARLAERTPPRTSGPPSSETVRSGVPTEDQQLPRQGMCDVVMIRIDNQRPSELQFNEDDFLDDEQSGDEDWNGNDVDAGVSEHAW